MPIGRRRCVERAEQLKAAPSVGGMSPIKAGGIDHWGKFAGEKPPKVAEAIKEYDAALTDYDKADRNETD